MSRFVRFAFVTLLASGFAAMSAGASDLVTLKASEGYDFVKKTVTKKGDANADFTFTVNPGKKGGIAARHLKGLGQGLPDAHAFQQVQSWPASAVEPMPGYYAIQGRDGKSVYLVSITGFADYGKPTSWEMSFTWEKLQ